MSSISSLVLVCYPEGPVGADSSALSSVLGLRVRRAHSGGVAPQADAILVLPPSTEPDTAALRSALDALVEDPALAGVVDLPPPPDSQSLALDMLIEPERVGAVLVRGDALRACSDSFPLDGALGRARTVLRVLRSLRLHRSRATIAPPLTSAMPTQEEQDAFAHEALRAFAAEDLYPTLRTEKGKGKLHQGLLHCSRRLAETGRRGLAEIVAAHAQAIIEHKDFGLGLQIESPARSLSPDPAQGFPLPVPRSPLVSVIVTTRDRPAMLLRALESLRAQTFRDFEVIVVNDGGRDSNGALESLVGSIGVSFSQVRHGSARGPAAARNAGLRLARGRYVNFLDDDDRLLPHHFATLLPALREGARVVFADARTVFESPAEPLPYTRTSRVIYQWDWDPERSGVDNFHPIQSVVFERDLIRTAGELDESLPYLEDWDLWLRIFAASPPVHVARVTSEIRKRIDAAPSQSGLSGADWLEALGYVYGRSLDLERVHPGLRQRRVAHMVRMTEIREAPFPIHCTRWLEGDDDLTAIDPAKPALAPKPAGSPSP